MVAVVQRLLKFFFSLLSVSVAFFLSIWTRSHCFILFVVISDIYFNQLGKEQPSTTTDSEGKKRKQDTHKKDVK